MFGYALKLLIVMIMLYFITLYYYVKYSIDLSKDYMNIVRAIRVWVNRK